MEQYILLSAPITQQAANNFICLLSSLATQGVSQVHIAINCGGGHVASGIAMHNCMRAMPFKIRTHNIGNVDSIANVVFLGGEERYACGASIFMFHGAGVNTGPNARLEERDLLERLDAVQAEHKRMSELISARTHLSMEECQELFKEQRMRDALWAKTKGLIREVRDFELPAGRNVLLLVHQGEQIKSSAQNKEAESCV